MITLNGLVPWHLGVKNRGRIILESYTATLGIIHQACKAQKKLGFALKTLFKSITILN